MPQALLIVDHGSRLEEANRMLEDVAEVLRRLRPDLIVHAAHMELAEPSIDQGLAACVRDGATDVVVQPYMLSPGRHAARDIPALVSDAASGHAGLKVTVASPLGVHEKIGEVVLERAGLLEPTDRPDQ